MILYFVIGFGSGILLTLLILLVWFRRASFGYLHSVEDEEDGAYLFLELNKKPEQLINQRHVVLKVKKAPPRE